MLVFVPFILGKVSVYYRHVVVAGLDGRLVHQVLLFVGGDERVELLLVIVGEWTQRRISPAILHIFHSHYIIFY